jgi:hypothetical protein
MNKIAITAWMGMTVRNVLFSPVIKNLINNFKVDIHTTFQDQIVKYKGLSENEINYPDIYFPKKNKILSWVLYHWNYHALWQQHKPATMEKYISLEKTNKPMMYLFNHFGGQFVNLVRKDKNIDWLRNFVYGIPLNQKLNDLDALLVTSTDSFKDQMLMYSCKKLGIPVVALVHSWDNLPARGLLSVLPDRMLVWNEYMVNDAINYHNMPEDKIDVVGVPQFELYRRKKANIDINSYRESMRIPDDVVTITYTASAERVFPDEPLFIETLLKYVTNGSFGNAILILRLHPSARKSLYISIYENTNLPIRLDIPDIGFSANSQLGKINYQGVDNFISLIMVSDVIINLASTITLDAILFDKPVICPKFNLSISTTSWNAAHRWYSSSHFIHITESRAVSMPVNMDELINDVQKYLENPFLKSTERQNLREKMIPNIPTGKLIAEAVQNAII